MCYLSAALLMLKWIGIILGVAVGFIGLVVLIVWLIEKLSDHLRYDLGINPTFKKWTKRTFIALMILAAILFFYWVAYMEICVNIDPPMSEIYTPDNAEGTWTLPTGEDLTSDVIFITDDGDTLYYTIK